MNDYTFLVKKFLRGDPAAYHRLLEDFRPKVWLYLLQKCPRQDAEDIFQDICLNVFTELESLREPEKFLGWVFVITRGHIHSYYSRRRENLHDELNFEAMLKDPKAGPDERVMLKRLRNCILNLEEPYRDVAILFFIVGLSSREISEVLELNVNTIKSYVNRAKMMLFKAVKKAGVCRS